MQIEINKLISTHQLLPHPEGGFYRETYRSPFSTGILYLLGKGDFSALHKIASYGGDALMVLEIDENFSVIETLINKENPQYVVAAHRWFGAYLPQEANWAFCGCTVAPAFDFKDFKLANSGDIAALSEDARGRISPILSGAIAF